MYTEELGREKEVRPGSACEAESAKLLVHLTQNAIVSAFESRAVPFDILGSLSSSGHMRELLKFFRDALWETAAIVAEEYSADILPKLASHILEHSASGAALIQKLALKSYRLWAIASLSYGNYLDKSIRYDAVTGRLLYPSQLEDLPLIPIVWGDIEFEHDGTHAVSNMVCQAV